MFLRRAPRSTYDVFLSYARVDEDIADALQQGLESFARPWWARRSMRVFRDRTALAAGTDLGRDLQVKIADSRWFVLIASPEAAGSDWVCSEVGFWRARTPSGRPEERLAVVLSDGKIDGSSGGVNWDGTTALPEELRNAFAGTPTWSSLPRRHDDDGGYVAALPEALDQRLRRLRARLRGRRVDPDAVLALRDCIESLAAAVRGVRREDIRVLERRRRHQRRAVGSLLLVLMIGLSALLGLVAWQREQDRLTAVASELAKRADDVREVDPVAALRFGLAAREIHPEHHDASLVATLTGSRVAAALGGPSPTPVVAALSPAGDLAAAGDATGKVVLWRIGPGGEATEAAQATVPVVDDLLISPDGALLAVIDHDVGVELHDITTPEQPMFRARIQVADVRTAAFTQDSRSLTTVTESGTEDLWDISDPDTPRRRDDVAVSPPSPPTSMPTDGRPDRYVEVGADGAVLLWSRQDRGVPHVAPAPLDVGSDPSSAALSHSGHLVAAGTVDGLVSLFDISDPDQPVPLGTAGRTETPMAKDVEVIFDPDDRFLVSAHETGTVLLTDIRDPAQPAPLSEVEMDADGTAKAVLLDPATRNLLVGGLAGVARPDVDDGDEGVIHVWDIVDPAHPRPLPAIREPDAGAISALARCTDELTVAGSLRGTLLFLGAGGTTVRAEHHSTAGAVRALACSPGGDVLAVGREDGTVSFWDVLDPTNPRQVSEVPAAAATAPAGAEFIADSDVLAVVNSDGGLVLLDSSDVQVPRAVTTVSTGLTEASGLAVTPDGKHVVVSGGRGTDTVVLVDLAAFHALRNDAVTIACTIVGGLDEASRRELAPSVSFEDPC